MEKTRQLNSIEIGNIRIVSETEPIGKLIKIAEKLYMRHRKKIEEDKSYMAMFG